MSTPPPRPYAQTLTPYATPQPAAVPAVVPPVRPAGRAPCLACRYGHTGAETAGCPGCTYRLGELINPRDSTRGGW